MLGGLLLLMAIVAMGLVMRWSVQNDDVSITGKTKGQIRMRYTGQETAAANIEADGVETETAGEADTKRGTNSARGKRRKPKRRQTSQRRGQSKWRNGRNV